MMGQSNKGFSETGLHKMRNVLARHVDSGKISGVVALVSRNGETHVEVLGTMRHDGGAPMRRDTIFRMASTSKPLAIAAADHRTGPADFHVRARHGYYVAGHSDHERDLREGAHARSTGADARAG